MFGILYLNNDGSRWRVTNKKDNRFVLVLPDGTRKVRQADHYGSFGNFAYTAYRYQGKQYKALAKSWAGYETRDNAAEGINALPHIFHT